MGLTAVAYRIGVLAAIIFAGFTVAKTGYIDGKVKDAISKLIVKAILPCIIISSVTSKEIE